MIKSKIIKIAMIAGLIALPFSVGALLQHEMHDESNHSQHQMMTGKSPLTMPGNDVFGTIQEVVRELEADPNTDWSKVDLEALRQHLIDMRHFTINVEVLSKEPIPGGVQIVVRPTVPEAKAYLQRVFNAHPQMLQAEKGWQMAVREDGDQFTLHVTTGNSSDVAKIRGLGYIGIMATGAHHTQHHWMIARGMSPHRTMHKSGAHE